MTSMQKNFWISPSEAVVEIAKGAASLAAKYPQLRRDSFEEFMEDAYDSGLELDFETGREMYGILMKSST